MSATKTLAFVLRVRDYRDTSLLGDFYTRDFGKIRGIIKGIRDGRERYGTTLEPFSLNEILFYRRKRGGDLHQITQADLVNLFVEVRQDLERLAYGSYFAELLNELVETEQSAPEIFDLFQESLTFLASGSSCKRCARIFEIKLLERLGLMPEIQGCVGCRKQEFEPILFNPALGGIHCGECAKSQSAALTKDFSNPETLKRFSSIPVSKGALVFLNHVKRSPMEALHHVKVSQEVGQKVQKMLTWFLEYHLNRKLKTVIFLEKMGYN